LLFFVCYAIYYGTGETVWWRAVTPSVRQTVDVSWSGER